MIAVAISDALTARAVLQIISLGIFFTVALDGAGIVNGACRGRKLNRDWVASRTYGPIGRNWGSAEAG